MADYYDRQGKPIDSETWIRLFEDKDYCRVALYEDERIRISTVWLGLNHSWTGGVLIFETMSFILEGSDVQEKYELQYRYATEEQAKKGHDLLCACYREGIEPYEPMKKLLEEFYQ